jgi:hypothetical protein
LVSGSNIQGMSVDGAAIGAGLAGSYGTSGIANITIWNTAIKEEYLWPEVDDVRRPGYGSIIGTGWADALGSTSFVGSLLVSDSRVRTSGLSIFWRYRSVTGIGAGVGSAHGISQIDDVTIWNSDINVKLSEDGSGVGTGCVYGGTSRIEHVAIVNSAIVVTGVVHGSVVGSAGSRSGGGSGTASIAALLILSSRVKATPGQYGSGIGTGLAQDGSCSIGILFVSSSNVDVSSDGGSCIGCGRVSGGTSTVDSIAIWNSTVVGGGSSNIGSGSTAWGGVSTVDNVAIWNSTIDAPIRSGMAYDGYSRTAVLLISSSCMKRSIVDGPGIGSGDVISSSATSWVGNTTVWNSTFEMGSAE